MSIRYGLQPQDLVVKSISVGTAFRKKGLDIRGHGHMGLKIRSYSNVHVIVEEGKPKLSKYGEKRRAAKLEKQARIKREFEEKHEKTIEFLSSSALIADSSEPDWKRERRRLELWKTRPFLSLPSHTRKIVRSQFFLPSAQSLDTWKQLLPRYAL
ncbi:hypothetical protein BLSTO_05863 [Blastocystis sp. subtype 1]